QTCRDIEAVSPNAIKENNKLAFELAHVLGISCPLTPSAMISATVPDKLLVSSLRFNMHQYFTRALPSAIAKDSTENGSASGSPNSEDKPSSPFDISKIHKVFDDPNIYSNLSPVTSPSHSVEVSKYSRHSSRRNSEEQEGGGRTIRVSGDHGVKTHSSGSSLVLGNTGDGSGADPTTQSNLGQVGDNPGQGGGNTGQGGGNAGQGGGNPGQGGGNVGQGGNNLGQGRTNAGQGFGVGVNEAGIALDQLVIASANPSRTGVPSISVSERSNDSSGDRNDGGGREGERREGEKREARKSTEEDRLLEFEGDSESEPRTSSSVSLDQSQSQTSLTTPAQPLDSLTGKDGSQSAVYVTQVTAGVGEREGGKGVEELEAGSAGKEEGKRKMEGQRGQLEGVGREEMGTVDETARTRSDSGSKPHRRLPALPTGSPEVTTKDEERRQMAKELLRKHRISPASADFSSSSSSPSPGKKKNPDSKQEKYREQVRMMLSEIQSSPSSSSRLPDPSADEENELAADRSSTSLPEIAEKEEEEHQKPQIPQNTSEEGGKEDTREVSPSLEPNEIVSYEDEPRAHRPDNDSFKRRVGVVNRPQVVVVGGGADSAHITGAAKPHSSKDTLGGGDKGSGQPDEAPPSEPRTRQKKPPVKELQIKPVVSKPSAAAQKLLESKRQQKRAGEGGAGVDTDGNRVESGGQVEGRKEEEEGETRNGDSEEKDTSGGSKLESPSPWDEHSEGLEKDILLTRNEYVRCELSRLRQQLLNMERRAVEIESDVRQAMSTGNKEDEETMMQEWFTLLNGKNELIKRQIELNLVEREEDLEKKQFFINRELRPLMAIPDEQKTPQQKVRVDTLVQDLLGIVDERDKVERKKMSIASKSTHRERDGFASDDSGLPPNQQRNASLDRTGSKDCVIS
ncbi:EH domain-binding protein 1, partial [Geodia barretti]